MAAVNTSLKLLGAPATAGASKAQLEQAATRAMAALEALRGLREAVPALMAKPLDAERAAGSLVSALAAQSMVSAASLCLSISSNAGWHWMIASNSAR